jgi:hypothetical protein
MKNITTTVLGFDVPVSGVPETLPEAVESAGGEQNLVDTFVNQRKFHNTNTEARAAVVDALVEVTNIARLTELKATPTKSDPNKTTEVDAESEQQYTDRVRAETKMTTAQLWDLVKDKVGVLAFKGQGEARGGGARTTKGDLTNAKVLIDAGEAKYNLAITMLEQKNPGLTVERDEKNVPKIESLAKALQTNRARAQAEENAALGIAA